MSLTAADLSECDSQVVIDTALKIVNLMSSLGHPLNKNAKTTIQNHEVSVLLIYPTIIGLIYDKISINIVDNLIDQKYISIFNYYPGQWNHKYFDLDNETQFHEIANIISNALEN